jgi:acyl-CoA thioesterase FadM
LDFKTTNDKYDTQPNETVIIKTQIIHTDDKSLIMEYQMWNEDKSHLKTILWSRFLHIDLLTKKTTPHPKDVEEMLEALVIPVVEVTIDERVKSLFGKS